MIFAAFATDTKLSALHTRKGIMPNVLFAPYAIANISSRPMPMWSIRYVYVWNTLQVFSKANSHRHSWVSQHLGISVFRFAKMTLPYGEEFALGIKLVLQRIGSAVCSLRLTFSNKGKRWAGNVSYLSKNLKLLLLLNALANAATPLQ